uniref:taste receptor type 2 member 20-like n=1 Tax=Jaculus jaculus TaxID=51337 RepID=UPI001E1B38EC|nr:taste receptor type 2 member 20-like [Jaculus jaculus]
MASLLPTIVSIVIVVEFVLGNFANVFIALVNCVDCIKKRKISIVDKILTALGVSRTVWLWVILMNWSSTVFYPDSHKRQVKFITVAWAVANHFSIWFATTLSIFYLLKIPNFSNRIFLYLQQKVKHVIVAVLLSMLILLFSNFTMANVCMMMQVSVHGGNVTGVIQLSDTARLTVVIFSTLSNAIPFMVSLICLLLLIYSLCKHVRKMKLHGKGSQDPSTAVHMKAVYTVVSFLLLLLMNFLSLITSLWYSNKPLAEPVHLLCQAIGMLYPSSHSYVLIWGNKKLKQAFLLARMKVKIHDSRLKHVDKRKFKMMLIGISLHASTRKFSTFVIVSYKTSGCFEEGISCPHDETELSGRLKDSQ